jgi:hypothetical protein
MELQKLTNATIEFGYGVAWRAHAYSSPLRKSMRMKLEWLFASRDCFRRIVPKNCAKSSPHGLASHYQNSTLIEQKPFSHGITPRFSANFNPHK